MAMGCLTMHSQVSTTSQEEALLASSVIKSSTLVPSIIVFFLTTLGCTRRNAPSPRSAGQVKARPWQFMMRLTAESSSETVSRKTPEVLASLVTSAGMA